MPAPGQAGTEDSADGFADVYYPVVQLDCASGQNALPVLEELKADRPYQSRKLTFVMKRSPPLNRSVGSDRG